MIRSSEDNLVVPLRTQGWFQNSTMSWALCACFTKLPLTSADLDMAIQSPTGLVVATGLRNLSGCTGPRECWLCIVYTKRRRRPQFPDRNADAKSFGQCSRSLTKPPNVATLGEGKHRVFQVARRTLRDWVSIAYVG